MGHARSWSHQSQSCEVDGRMKRKSLVTLEPNAGVYDIPSIAAANGVLMVKLDARIRVLVVNLDNTPKQLKNCQRIRLIQIRMYRIIPSDLNITDIFIVAQESMDETSQRYHMVEVVQYRSETIDADYVEET